MGKIWGTSQSVLHNVLYGWCKRVVTVERNSIPVIYKEGDARLQGFLTRGRGDLRIFVTDHEGCHMNLTKAFFFKSRYVITLRISDR